MFVPHNLSYTRYLPLPRFVASSCPSPRKPRPVHPVIPCNHVPYLISIQFQSSYAHTTVPGSFLWLPRSLCIYSLEHTRSMITLVVNAARVPVRRSPELLDQSRGPSGMCASCCSQKNGPASSQLKKICKMVIWEDVRGCLVVTWDYEVATNVNFE